MTCLPVVTLRPSVLSIYRWAFIRIIWSLDIVTVLPSIIGLAMGTTSGESHSAIELSGRGRVVRRRGPLSRTTSPSPAPCEMGEGLTAVAAGHRPIRSAVVHV